MNNLLQNKMLLFSPFVENKRLSTRNSYRISEEYFDKIVHETAFLNAEIPVHLLKFSEVSSWVAIDKKSKVLLPSSLENSHIFLKGFLLKNDDPNKIFETLRQIIHPESLFAFKIVTAENVKAKLISKYHKVGFYLYYPFYFLLHRFLPKFKGIREIYKLLPIASDISKAEILGRLVYKGFKIIDVYEINNETFIVSKKGNYNHSITKPQPNEGFIFNMQRMGKDAKNITVYKFRSMHPYSEYIQDYLYQQHGLDAGGKFKKDFRITTGGRIIRKYWIDEIPMLFNLIKGDLKLVGVRPISNQYFNLYPPELQEKRLKHKPGLIPPFYADLPKTLPEIINSEWKYLVSYENNPTQTDLRYFFKILKNILFKKARSQ